VVVEAKYALVTLPAVLAATLYIGLQAAPGQDMVPHIKDTGIAVNSVNSWFAMECGGGFCCVAQQIGSRLHRDKASNGCTHSAAG
jgi:hypothetical protein